MSNLDVVFIPMGSEYTQLEGISRKLSMNNIKDIRTALRCWMLNYVKENKLSHLIGAVLFIEEKNEGKQYVVIRSHQMEKYFPCCLDNVIKVAEYKNKRIELRVI